MAFLEAVMELTSDLVVAHPSLGSCNIPAAATLQVLLAAATAALSLVGDQGVLLAMACVRLSFCTSHLLHCATPSKAAPAAEQLRLLHERQARVLTENDERALWQLVGLRLQVVQQVPFLVVGSTASTTTSNGSGSEHGEGCAPGVVNNQTAVEVMLGSLMLLTNELSPLVTPAQLTVSLQHPQHLMQLAHTFQVAEAAVRVLTSAANAQAETVTAKSPYKTAQQSSGFRNKVVTGLQPLLCVLPQQLAVLLLWGPPAIAEAQHAQQPQGPNLAQEQQQQQHKSQ